jgi:hypothetical protein
MPQRIKKEASKYSCGVRLPSVDDFLNKLKPSVSPSQYNIKEELVKQTRFSKILAGGTMPKDGLIIDKNPGVGEYEQKNNIIDKVISKSPRTSSFFASTHGKSYYQASLTPGD